MFNQAQALYIKGFEMFINQQQDWSELNNEFNLCVVCDVLYTCFGKSENFTDDGLFFACSI
jgi:hypothetical protein